jgi:hypothetical protein
VILSAVAPHLDEHPPMPEPAPLVAPCDPGFGFPQPSATCPDQHPLLGRVWFDGSRPVQLSELYRP